MQQLLKPLPASTSDIATIINNNFLYVDKTKFIYEMVKLPSKFFLSRPRRFGKSTLLSTLYEVFMGNKELFKDQWIYHSDWSWQEFPIIQLDFNVDTDVDLKQYIKEKLKIIAVKYDVFDLDDFNRLSYGLYFNDLVIKLFNKYNKQQVIILIDEYDKPILDVIDDFTEAKTRRDILKGFYTVIKGLDAYVRFVFLTGVTRFSKVGVFSGLNNLDDISMDNRYASICGITQEELNKYFTGYIEVLATQQNMSYEDCALKIKEWYNGFCFCENSQSVYNPYSTINLFLKQKFSNYWFTSGNPSFLMKLIKKDANVELFQLDECKLNASQFDSFEIDDLNINAILFQAGYLTIKGYLEKSERYILSYPNYEINKSFKENLFDAFGKSRSSNQSYLNKIVDAFEKNDIETIIYYLKQIFLNIDYDVKVSKEKHYQSIIYLIFQLLGYQITMEYKTNIGRIDAIIQTDDNIYIFEFKVDQTAQEALAQIKNKSYYERFVSTKKSIFLIGVNFNSELRNIDDYILEQVVDL